MTTTWRWLGCRSEDGKNVFDQELADRDVAACKEIHKRQVERYGKDIVGDEPNLLKWPVFLSLVAEREGKVCDYFYLEAQLEGCMGGCDTRAAASLRRYAPSLIKRITGKGFRFVRTVVPRVVEGPVGKELTRTGFAEQPAKDYAHFLLDLRGGGK